MKKSALALILILISLNLYGLESTSEQKRVFIDCFKNDKIMVDIIRDVKTRLGNPNNSKIDKLSIYGLFEILNEWEREYLHHLTNKCAGENGLLPENNSKTISTGNLCSSSSISISIN